MKSNLLQFLFGKDLVQESNRTLGEQVVRLFEEAAQEEAVELVANKQPLQKVLKSLGIDIEPDPYYQWAEIRCSDLDEYRAHCDILFTPENMHTLAVAGWVPVKCGDKGMTFEPADCKIGFIEISVAEGGDSDKAPDAEKIRKDAQAFAATEVDRDDEMNPVEYDLTGSSDGQKGVGKETEGTGPEGKPKGYKNTTESQSIHEWGGYYCPKCKDRCQGKTKGDKCCCEKCGTDLPKKSSSLRSREVRGSAKKVAENLLDEMTSASAIPAVESPMLASSIGVASRLKKLKARRKGTDDKRD